MTKKIPSILFLIIIFFSCDKEENISVYEDLKISYFEISKNDLNGIVTRASIMPPNVEHYNITSHGVVLLKDRDFLDRIDLGNLKENNFQTNIVSGLIKGERYDVFPYIVSDFGVVRGDTLSFISNVDVDFLISDLSPKNGFIKDTITIKGENFCNSTLNNRNLLLLGDSYHTVFVESDSILKATINSSLSSSTLIPSLRSCGIVKEIGESFLVDPPVLDSISSQSLYVGDELSIYGKNIHSDISKVWLEGIELELLESESIIELKAIIPDNLPSGKLDFKLQVLDRIIEIPDYYQSTTPYIKEIMPSVTGYLETVQLKGKYFEQSNTEIKVFIGHVDQTIISTSDEEILIRLDKRIFSADPLIEVKIGPFIASGSITMLSPEILGFDKDRYHYTDQVTVHTRYFYGEGYDAVLAGRPNSFSLNSLQFDATNGNIDFSFEEWRNSTYDTFIMSEPGAMEFKIETVAGVATKNLFFYPPTISNIDKTEYYLGQEMKITGTDFINESVSKISIDETFLTEGIGPFTNTNIQLYKLPNELYPGPHKLKVVTAGQESNEIEFYIKPVVATRLITTRGTRKNTFYIEGENLEIAGTVKVNGKGCEIVDRSSTQLGFKLPPEFEYPQFSEVIFEYGPQSFNLGNIEIVEPYEEIYPFQLPPGYSYSFDARFFYKGNLHTISEGAMYRFNTSDYSWTSLDTSSPTSLFLYSGKELPVDDDKLYIPEGKDLHIYDFVTRVWSRETVPLEEQEQIQRIVVKDNILYALVAGNSTGYRIYKIDLSTYSKQQINYPTSGPIDLFHCSNGKIILNTINDNIFILDTTSDTWTDIGHPKSSIYQQKKSLHYYNNVLYYSGGTYSSYPQREMYAYDFNTGSWNEKTPMFHPVMQHGVMGSGQYLYILLGNVYYGNWDNIYLMIYDISKDLH